MVYPVFRFYDVFVQINTRIKQNLVDLRDDAAAYDRNAQPFVPTLTLLARDVGEVSLSRLELPCRRHPINARDIFSEFYNVRGTHTLNRPLCRRLLSHSCGNLGGFLNDEVALQALKHWLGR